MENVAHACTAYGNRARDPTDTDDVLRASGQQMKDGRISVEMHGPAGRCCDAVKATLHLMTRGYHHASPHLRRFYTSENLAQQPNAEESVFTSTKEVMFSLVSACLSLDRVTKKLPIKSL